MKQTESSDLDNNGSAANNVSKR